MGPDLDSFSHTDVNNFVKRSPFINFFKGYRKVFFPVNQNNKHWTLIVIDFEIKSLTYFDLCGGSTTPFFVDEKQPGDINDRRHPILKMWEFMIYWSH